jgi:hypothetical protein
VARLPEAGRPKGLTPDIKSVYCTKVRASICAPRIRRSIVKGYTVAYATVGASDFVMFVANARAGGSVTLPASRPVSTA